MMMPADKKYRLVMCVVLLKSMGILDDIKFVHPKDVQDGKVDITANDITTNLPYAPAAHLAFDLHASETLRVTRKPVNHVIDADAPSAAATTTRDVPGGQRPGRDRAGGAD